MAKQKVRATRHNGRKGENGVFKAGHNDRSFDVDAAEHIDPSRSFMNVYWDMYQGYNIANKYGVYMIDKEQVTRTYVAPSPLAAE